MLNLNLEGIKALFIDCDGTLADTMPAHKLAYKLAFAANNVPFNEEIFDECAPLGGDVLMPRMIAPYDDVDESVIHDIVQDKQHLLKFALEKSMKVNEELVNFIKFNKDDDLQIFVVSTGRRGSIIQILDILGITWKITGLITKENVKHTKPRPDPYLLALEIAKVTPEEVIVFEDNLVGTTAARAAGITNIVEVKTDEF